MSLMDFIENDGGRAVAGFRGRTGDCVVRAIAIASQSPYKEIYEELSDVCKAVEWVKKQNKRLKDRPKSSPRIGIESDIIREYLKIKGWTWVPTMLIGSGCKVHLTKSELPNGRLIVNVSKHITTMIDGVIHDTHDPSRGGKRCVYGYWRKNES